MIAHALAGWDWAFVVWSLLVVVGVGLWYSRRAGKNLDEYFLSGRNLPWWALGTSMVATTFAADTPLAVTELVVKEGVAGNWVWWNFLLGGTLTVFVFSRLWRRSRVVTEIELVARRYDGAPARALRGFKAVYLGLVLNSIVIGWVTKGMVTVMRTVFPEVDEFAILAVLIVLTFVYTAISGLWGVVATDVLQFAMAMIGAILLAALAVAEVGGLGELVARVETIEAETGRSLLAMFPAEPWTAAFLVLALVNWWAVYYPGAEPGGGGYVAQRMLAAKDETHARAGTLWFIFAHYVVRPWPWVLVALSAMVLEPRYRAAGLEGAVAQSAYPAMFRLLPVGLYGLVIASFVAAYMSTITSQLNLAASYLVNDLYLPFLAKGRPSPRTQVAVARGSVALVTLTGSLVALAMASVQEGWQTIMDLTAGIGLVLILRWLWWRVNAWSEITAMVASAGCYIALHVRFGPGDEAEAVTPIEPRLALLTTVAVTTAAWLLVTLLTRPVGRERLEEFYREVRPGGWWGPIARATGLPPTSLRRDAAMWLAAIALVFGALIAAGSALFLRWRDAGGYGLLATAGLVALLALLRGERRRRALVAHAADTSSA